MSLRNIVDLRGKPPRFLGNARLPLRGPEKRIPLRSRRRRTRAILAACAILFVAAAAYGVHWASYLSALSIRDVSIHGTERVPSELVAQYIDDILHQEKLRYISRRNIFLYPKEVIARDLVVDFPRIKAANVERASFMDTTLLVSVQEREPFARWCASEGKCYVLDDSGYIFAEDDPRNGRVVTPYTFSGGLSATSAPIGQYFIQAHLPGLFALIQSLGQAGYSAQSVSVDQNDDFSVRFDEGFRVKATFGSDANMLTRNLKLVLDSEALHSKIPDVEYIDLRFGNRVYYKLKGEEEKTDP